MVITFKRQTTMAQIQYTFNVDNSKHISSITDDNSLLYMEYDDLKQLELELPINNTNSVMFTSALILLIPSRSSKAWCVPISHQLDDNWSKKQCVNINASKSKLVSSIQHKEQHLISSTWFMVTPKKKKITTFQVFYRQEVNCLH